MDEQRRYRPVPVPTEDERMRFWRMVDTQSTPLGCWEWKGTPSKPYGSFKLRGQEFPAHRVAYVIAHGSVDRDNVVDHLCENTRCVRPSVHHLEQKPQRDNVLRGTSPAARNAQATHCPAGHPYDETNTRIARHGDGWQRQCRVCDRERHYTARHAAEEMAA